MSDILLLKIILLPESQRGMWCQACKNVWTTDLDKLSIKEQSTKGNTQTRVLSVKCPHCNFKGSVTIQGEMEPLFPEYDVDDWAQRQEGVSQ